VATTPAVGGLAVEEARRARARFLIAGRGSAAETPGYRKSLCLRSTL
jgi:hypothetical protein